MKLLKNVYDKLDINVSDIDIKIPSTSGLNYSMIQIKKISKQCLRMLLKR